MYPFERFTERAKKVLMLAQVEAERAHHSYIGTEHLLLAVMEEGGGLGARALANLDVDAGRVREAIGTALGQQESSGEVQQIVPTSRVKQVVQSAFEEAHRMGVSFVGTEHLLLGILIEGKGLAAQVLEGMGVTLTVAREEVARLVESGPPGKAPATPSLPASPKVAEVLARANAMAAGAGASEVGLEHLERAIANWHAEHQ